MSDEKKPAPKPDAIMPADATPPNPGLAPRPDGGGDAGTAGEPPYEKKSDPARQPS